MTGEAVAELQSAVPVRELPRFYSYAEVVAAFGKSTRTIRWWVKSGHIHAIKIGRARLISEAEIFRLANGEDATASSNSTELSQSTLRDED
ncbi:MAG: helix-turn-helix domain-containing protein [Betaproteobacteria bacterium]|nr:helix-turn-helix domain-containing protein [Rhodospirillales bacterium]MDE2442688.1 helix-turn-helix domain-containing protein [Betaproteobacteria bacterium]